MGTEDTLSGVEDWLFLSARHRDRGDYGQAIDVLEQAVAIGEETAAICKELARLSLVVNEVRAFANWCHEAMRIDPADPEPYLMVSRVLVAQARWAEVVEALEQALRLGRINAADRAEAETTLAKARAEYAAYKRLHPGSSNL